MTRVKTHWQFFMNNVIYKIYYILKILSLPTSIFNNLCKQGVFFYFFEWKTISVT